MTLTWGQYDATEAGPAWAIVCPGPSLDDADLEPIADLPTIVVEGAAAHPSIEYGWWCSWGLPHRPAHASAAARARVLQPAIVTRYLFAWHWRDFAHDLLSTPLAPQGPAVIAQHPRYDCPPASWTRAHLDAGPSWLVALRFAVLRASARSIHFVGLDLAGTTYALEQPDTRLRHPDEWEGRWYGERRIFAAAVDLCLALGVTVRAGPLLGDHVSPRPIAPAEPRDEHARPTGP